MVAAVRFECFAVASNPSLCETPPNSHTPKRYHQPPHRVRITPSPAPSTRRHHHRIAILAVQARHHKIKTRHEHIHRQTRRRHWLHHRLHHHVHQFTLTTLARSQNSLASQVELTVGGISVLSPVYISPFHQLQHLSLSFRQPRQRIRRVHAQAFRSAAVVGVWRTLAPLLQVHLGTEH